MATKKKAAKRKTAAKKKPAARRSSSGKSAKAAKRKSGVKKKATAKKSSPKRMVKKSAPRKIAASSRKENLQKRPSSKPMMGPGDQPSTSAAPPAPTYTPSRDYEPMEESKEINKDMDE